MQTHHQMRDPDRFAYTKSYVAFDDVAGRVLFVWVFGLDVEVCNIPRFGAEGRCDAG